MKVSDILDRKGRDVITLGPDEQIRDAVELFNRRNIGAAPVVGADGDLIGIVSERDVVAALASKGGEALDVPVRRIMSEHLLTCAPDHSIRSVIRTMTERRVRHMPVLEGGRLVGIVSIGDVLKPRLDENELEMGVLRDMARAHIV